MERKNTQKTIDKNDLVSLIKGFEIARICEKVGKVGNLIGATTFLVGAIKKSKHIKIVGLAIQTAFLAQTITARKVKESKSKKLSEMENQAFIVTDSKSTKQETPYYDDYSFDVGM